MKLSEHFTKEELTYSDSAIKYKIKNEPNAVQLKVLTHTCEYFLEPLRKLLNEHYKTYNNKKVRYACIKITSGLRVAALNKRIGGSNTSQHTKGEAVDFHVILVCVDGTRIALTHTETYNFIKRNVKQGRLSVDQAICESSGNSNWVHASYKAAGATVNRNQFMIYKNGKYSIDKT